ncbi:diguanylate cyclase [Pelagibacterium halotolerans]|uniref:GGDEF domain-containing protein n=1 Tax=Pelagibacterium halotolerans TaxID=531813 RepID=UPI00384C5271
MGLQDESYDCASQAVELAEAGNDDWCLAFALYVQAVTIGLGGDTDTALAITERSADIARVLQDSHLLSWILLGQGYQVADLADANEHTDSEQAFLQRYEEAIALTLEAQNLALDNGDTWTLRKTLVNCADLYSHLGRYADAHAQLDTWLQVQGQPTSRERRQYLANLAETLLHEGKLAEARERCSEALEQAEVASDVGQIAQYAKLLGQIEEESGNLGEALRLYKYFYRQEKRYEGELVKQRARVATVYYDTKSLHKQVEEARTMMLLTERQAFTDELTGIANRRALHNALEALGDGNARNYALIYADIDHFKSINDRFSHQTGDLVIKTFADILSRVCRQSDMVARQGGEEFVILLNRANTEHAIVVCNRIMDCLHEYNWSAIAPGLKVTASFGLAMDFEAANWNSVLALADARLYLAKASGRNRLVTAGGVT